MISKKIHSFLLIFLLIVYSHNIKAQNLELINASLQLLNSINNSSNCECSQTLNIDRPLYDGKIILKDSTILTGRISVNHHFDNKMITVLNENYAYKLIDNEMIKEVEIINHENEITVETKFINLNKDEKLYRLVYQKNSKISIYDSSDSPQNNSLVGKVFVKENNIITDTWNFWTSGPKKDLINYLNDREGTNYKIRDFKSLNDLFVKL
ncbi:hypothetical protein HSX10_13520 [Winogradskyella undariae]|uniref:hypothetical protein n=1 Tax=Winogradskyella undariae TaxID=1285465 RepID=UPI00156B98A2|nr:hypothetical protein [Winogradskyella undariae]NRR92587.1 hypothetical protein [Winogradskyella undariae]